MAKRISVEVRRELVRAIGERYRSGSVDAKARILDEFVEVTGYHRKHSIRVLNSATAATVTARSPRLRLYDEAVCEGLIVLAAVLAERSVPAELMTTAEAGAYAKVSPATVRRWIAAGKLPEHRAGREVRIARADLDALLQRGTRRPQPQNSEKTPEDLAAERFG